MRGWHEENMTCVPFPQHMFQSPGASPEVVEAQGRGRCMPNHTAGAKTVREWVWTARVYMPVCVITVVGKENTLRHEERAMAPKDPGHGEVRE